MHRLFIFTLLASSIANAEVSAVYTTDIASVLDGGLKRGTVFLDNFELSKSQATQQGEWSGTLLYTNSNTFSDTYVGDAQVVSNIGNTSMIRLYELWYRHDIAHHSWQVGLIDLNGLYDAIDTAGLFLNSSHGIGPDFSQTGDNGPSIFPVTSLALNWQWQIDDNTQWQVGIFDAIPGDPDNSHRNTIKLNSEEGALITSELNINRGNLRYALGAWHYTSNSEYMDGTRSSNNDGLYGIVESAADDQTNAIGWWFRAGIADKNINASDQYTGAGVTIQNFNESRPDDVMGIALAYSATSPFLINTEQATSGETAIELTYSSQITPWLRLQPDLQYVVNPSAIASRKNALVFIVRAEIDLMSL